MHFHQLCRASQLVSSSYYASIWKGRASHVFGQDANTDLRAMTYTHGTAWNIPVARLRDIRRRTEYSFVSLSTGDTAKVHFPPSDEWKMRGPADGITGKKQGRDASRGYKFFLGRKKRINEAGSNGWFSFKREEKRRREGKERKKKRKKEKKKEWLVQTKRGAFRERKFLFQLRQVHSHGPKSRESFDGLFFFSLFLLFQPSASKEERQALFDANFVI